jgi:hypothetical protein
LLRGFGLLEPEISNHSRQLPRVVQLRRVLESIVGSGEREVLFALVSASQYMAIVVEERTLLARCPSEEPDAGYVAIVLSYSSIARAQAFPVPSQSRSFERINTLLDYPWPKAES